MPIVLTTPTHTVVGMPNKPCKGDSAASRQAQMIGAELRATHPWSSGRDGNCCATMQVRREWSGRKTWAQVEQIMQGGRCEPCVPCLPTRSCGCEAIGWHVEAYLSVKMTSFGCHETLDALIADTVGLRLPLT